MAGRLGFDGERGEHEVHLRDDLELLLLVFEDIARQRHGLIH